MPAEFPRDRWGRPLVKNPATDNLDPFGRPSDFGRVLDDLYALNMWKLRTAATGLSMRPDLGAQFAAIVAADEKGSSRKLDALVDDCIEAAGGNKGRRLGEALHQYLELVNKAIDVTPIEPWDRDIDAYRTTLKVYGLRPLVDLVEIAVVNDTFKTAGSPDVFLEVIDPAPLNSLSINVEQGDVIVGDPKTGKSAPTSNQYAVQLYLYASSRRYDLETGARTPIHPRLRHDIGLLIHLPAGQARCELHAVDLIEAAMRAELARDVRAAMKDITYINVLEQPAPPAPSQPSKTTNKVTIPPKTDLQARLELIIMAENGKRVLADLWIDAAPGFPPKHLANHLHDAEAMTIVDKVLSKAEDLLSLPFNEVAPPAKRATKKKTTVPRDPNSIDEGDKADPTALGILADRINGYPQDIRSTIKTWATDAKNAGTPISLSQVKSVRRFEIARAIDTVVHRVDVEQVEEVLDLLLSYLGYGIGDVGSRLARLNATQAIQLSDAADTFAAGGFALVVDTNGASRLQLSN